MCVSGANYARAYNPQRNPNPALVVHSIARNPADFGSDVPTPGGMLGTASPYPAMRNFPT